LKKTTFVGSRAGQGEKGKNFLGTNTPLAARIEQKKEHSSNHRACASGRGVKKVTDALSKFRIRRRRGGGAKGRNSCT